MFPNQQIVALRIREHNVGEDVGQGVGSNLPPRTNPRAIHPL